MADDAFSAMPGFPGRRRPPTDHAQDLGGGVPGRRSLDASQSIGDIDPIIVLEARQSEIRAYADALGFYGRSEAREAADQAWTPLKILGIRLLAEREPGPIRRFLIESLGVTRTADQGRTPERHQRFLSQLLTDLHRLAIQILGIRLLSDPRDTGRVRRYLTSSDPLLRATALTSPFAPFAARRALVGLPTATEKEMAQYGQATAWELLYLAQNSTLKVEELKGIVARLYSEDPAFWPPFPDEEGTAHAGSALADHITDRWRSRQGLRDSVLLRVMEHRACPAETIHHILIERNPSEIEEPHMAPIIERLMENAPGRTVLGQWHDRYFRQRGAEASPLIRAHHVTLLHGNLGQQELNALFRVVEIRTLLDAIQSTRGRIAQDAHETARAILLQRVHEQAPDRLEEAWESLKGVRMVAAAMAALPNPRAKVLASQQPELPRRFREHVERWATTQRDNPATRDAATEIMFNLGATRYEDQAKRTATEAIDWGRRQVKPTERQLWKRMSSDATSPRGPQEPPQPSAPPPPEDSPQASPTESDAPDSPPPPTSL